MQKLIILITFILISFFSLLNGSTENKYATIKLDGTVNPIIAEHIVNSIEKANNEKCLFIVIQMDTPGGLMSSMREIIKAILSSKIPVVVFTFPKGAQAASAGGYIMLSAHIAVMAPGTEIGAMHPVSPFLDFGKKNEDGSEGIMETKVLNDTLAYARSLSQKRNRNIQWTENAVKNAISSTYIEAKKLGVIDLIADDMNDLLKKLNGRIVNMDGYPVLLNTTNVKETVYEMDLTQKFLNYLADPQFVFLLFIIAVVGIGLEVKNPGMIFPGTLGGIALFLFLLTIRVLPINILGLSLIIISIVLFILELKFVSYGLLTIGGIASFVLGSMILFDSPLPGMSVPIASIIIVVIFLLLFFFVLIRSVLAAHRGKVTTGIEGMIGEKGNAVADFNKYGKIMAHGEYWNAFSDDDIKKDDPVIVEGYDGMTLIIKKLKND
ncbi:MAG: nodulation protein NfeD [Spirochaetota bacterium]